MKLLLIALFALPLTLLAQNKQAVYLKLSPSLLFEKDRDPRFAGFASLDGKFGQYLVAGISGGYMKLEGFDKGIFPLGLDVNIANFDKGKFSPVVMGGIYYPTNDIKVKVPGDAYTLKGKLFYQVGAGVSIRGTHSKKQRLFLTGSFAQLVYSTPGRPVTGISYDKNQKQEFFILSMSFML